MNYLTQSAWNRSRSPLTELRREMDRLFDDFWSAPAISRYYPMEAQWSPVCDVEEKEGHFLISLEMPGVPKDQIKVELQDNWLMISGERRQESTKSEDGQTYSERVYGQFQRSFMLPAGVNADKLEASYQDGVLRVYIPKAETAKPRQIKISNGSGTGFFGKLLGSSKKEQEAKHSPNEVKTEDVA